MPDAPVSRINRTPRLAPLGGIFPVLEEAFPPEAGKCQRFRLSRPLLIGDCDARL